MTKPLSNTLKLIISIAVPVLAGAIGTIFTTPAIPTWYASLAKPALNPPSWLFGPVWSTLYVLMGIALFIVWKKGTDKKQVRQSLTIFAVQIALNTLWSIAFFGFHSPLAGLTVITLLWISIILTMISFAKTSRTAVWLLVPYLLWVSFASYLNYAIFILN